MEQSAYVKYRLSNVLEINKIVTIHYFEFAKNFTGPSESHNFWEMVYVDAGSILTTAQNQTYELRQGDALFHKPNEFHNLRTGGHAANVFIISFVCTSSAMNYFKGRRLQVPSHLRDPIAKIIKEAAQTFDLPFFDPGLKQLTLLNQPIFGGQQMIKTYLEQFLILLIRSGTKEDKVLTRCLTENTLASGIQSYLESHVYQSVTLAQICRQFNYSKTHLCGLFKNVTGCSIMQYFTLLKVEEAKKLIREQNYNFTEISALLNISDPHYFSHLFKKVTGMSPRTYAKSVKL